MTYHEGIIDPNFKIQLSPAVSQKEILKQFQAGAGMTAEQTAQLTKVMVKIEAVGDYEDMEKLRSLLKQLAKD